MSGGQLAAFVALQSDPLGLLGDIFYSKPEELAALRIDPNYLMTLKRMAETYLGDTAFSQLQHNVVRDILEHRLPLSAVELIERFVARVQGERRKWRLRAAIAAGPSGADDFTMDQFIAHAAAELKKVQQPPSAPKSGMSMTRRGDRNWTLAIHGKGAAITALFRTLRAAAAQVEGEDPKHAEPQDFGGVHGSAAGTQGTQGAAGTQDTAGIQGTQGTAGEPLEPSEPNVPNEPRGSRATFPSPEPLEPAEAILKALSHGYGQHGHDQHGQPLGRILQVFTPIVQVPLDAATKILDGTQDETLFACSDGVRRTATELASSIISNEWGFALFHPVQGPVDLVFASRTANRKQRLLAMSEHATCAWDGCQRPVEECEMHHIQAWKHGGPTNMANLVPLCSFHNAWNDDDPLAPSRHGRIERRNGVVGRVFRKGKRFSPG